MEHKEQSSGQAEDEMESFTEEHIIFLALSTFSKVTVSITTDTYTHIHNTHIHIHNRNTILNTWEMLSHVTNSRTFYKT